MDFTKYLSVAGNWLSWFLGSVNGTVADTILGGWMAVAGFFAVVIVLFLVTSLFSPRSD